MFNLPGPLASSLRRLSQQEGVTLFMTLLAAFEGLLSRYSGQEDIVVGTPIANRRHSELEGIIGFFVNSLAMRLKLDGQPGVREVLSRMRESALAAYAHQDLPFERLVDALHPQRVMSYPPLFQVMFDLQHVASTPLGLPALHAAFMPVETGIARFDLTLTMHESEQGLLGVLEYNLDLFDPTTIQRMAGHFQTLLEGMVANPEARFASLTLLTAAEYQQLLFDWNATGTGYPQHRCLPALFEEQVERSPDAIALVFEEQQLTYHELNLRANQLAHHLQHLGVKPETLVGLYLERSLEMLVGLLGVLKAGAAYLPLDPAVPQERLAFMLADSQAAVLLTQSRLSHILKEQHTPIICLDTDWQAMLSEPVSNPRSGASADSLAYVIYTSGSTGQPKGVLVSHAQVTRLFAATNSLFHFDGHDHWTLFHSSAFDFSVWEIWGALFYGGRLVVVPFWQSRSPQDFSALLRSQHITVLNQTPSAFRQLINIEDASQTAADLHLRLVIFGGEALDPRNLQPWFERHGDHLPQLVNMYGITETTVHVTSYTLHESDLQSEVQSPIGRPLSDLQVYILDAQMQPVPVGVVGEMYIGGAGLSRGYLNHPDLTAARFVPNPFSQQMGTRLYKTGDLARFLPDGQLAYLGRNDAQVKIRGFRIELGEIEAALIQYPAVDEAVVVTHEEPSGNKRLVAYLVSQSESEIPATADLRHFLARQLPDYMVPALFVFLKALPLTSNGKLDRRALPAPERSRSVPDEAYAAPRTAAEELLADIWCTVLNLAQVGIYDNFFELGGDSILSIQVVAKANAAGISLTPRLLFQHQTIAQLAAASSITAMVQVEQRPVLGSMPLIPIQHWFFQRNLPAPHHWNQALLVEVRQPLDPALLTQALQTLLFHHDALRLRAEREADSWHLFHADPDEHIAFTQVDLAALPLQEQTTTLSSAITQLQASLNLPDGPIVRAALFNLGPQQPARLLLVIHHLAIDIVSWPILLEDIQTAYQHLSQGQPVRLPPKTTSFQHWAQRLVEYAQTPAVRQQGDFWLGQPWAEVRPLPLDTAAGHETNTEASAQTVVVALSAEETQALLSDVPRAYRTHINEVLLTALVQAFVRWTGQTSLLLHLEGHGRENLFDDVDLTRTVGWFTALIPLVLTLPENSEPGEALKRIKELLRSVPQNGIGFGLLRYLSEDASFAEQLAALPQPEVSFNYGGRSALVAEEGLFAPAAEPVGATHSLTGQRPYVLDVYGRILEGQLYLGWTYSENLHQRTTIERLAQSYLDALRTLIAHCQSPKAGGYTPSDFPEAALSQATLDALVASVTTVAKRDEEFVQPSLEAMYPLSPMQEGMLFHSLYAPQLEVYFEQFAYTLQGDLDVLAFKAAWQSVVAQHASLRTFFVWEHLDSPLQVVRQQVELPWTELDWRNLSANKQRENLQRWLQDDRARGFDLSQAPLQRMSLIRLSDQVTHFTWSFHHLILDGWSVFTILGQVFACYEALRQGKTFHLPVARLYRDYIAWLRQQNLAQAETFWRETLRGFTTPTPLGIDRPHRRKTELAGDYHSHRVRISKDTTLALQTLARQQQLTLNTVIQGAWALLLSYYSGEPDVIFGTTVAGRPAALADVESMVGLFINTLPVRIQVEPQQQLLPWLKALQAQQAEARQYEYSPLVQVQGWSEVPRGQTLFESLLIFANYPVDVSFVQESSLEIVNAQVVERTNYPLTMSVTPLASLLVSVTYAGTHFTHENILRMLGHLQTLLEGMVANPQQRLSELPFLTEAERQQLLLNWNATKTSYLQDTRLHTLFEQQVERTPEAIALVMATASPVFAEQQLTYGELNARANQLAHYLQRLGVGPEICVGLCMERSAELIISLLAILKAGGAYVPLEPSLPP